MEFIKLFTKPEYLALLISIIAICVNVYISHKNRKNVFAKDEYFKLQQIAENIIGKLLILNTQMEKLRLYFESARDAHQKGGKVIDTNDTFNKDDFERNGEITGAYIEIYFQKEKEIWHDTLESMGALFTHVKQISLALNKEGEINWKYEAECFNKISTSIGNKPFDIVKRIKEDLAKYKKDNL